MHYDSGHAERMKRCQEPLFSPQKMDVKNRGKRWSGTFSSQRKKRYLTPFSDSEMRESALPCFFP